MITKKIAEMLIKWEKTKDISVASDICEELAKDEGMQFWQEIEKINDQLNIIKDNAQVQMDAIFKLQQGASKNDKRS